RPPPVRPPGPGRRSRPCRRWRRASARGRAPDRARTAAVAPGSRVPTSLQGGALGRRHRQLGPPAVAQCLDGAELRLVAHLAALLDPVAEVKVGQAELAALLDLPEDVVGAVARPGD